MSAADHSQEKQGPGLLGTLIEASPTLSYFSALSLGMPQSYLSLAIACLAGLVIWIERRRRVLQDPIWLGCNLHFMIAGPLIWALVLSGQRGLADLLLDRVLLGVPLLVTLVLVIRAARQPSRDALITAAVALLAFGYAALQDGSHVQVIAIPLGVIFWTRIILRAF